jgi:hypothetical protein
LAAVRFLPAGTFVGPLRIPRTGRRFRGPEQLGGATIGDAS